MYTYILSLLKPPPISTILKRVIGNNYFEVFPEYQTLLCVLSFVNSCNPLLLSFINSCNSLVSAFPDGSDGKESVCNAGDPGKIPWRREWLPPPVFLLGEPHGQRSLAGCSLWSRKELDTTEHLTLYYSLHHILFGWNCHLHFTVDYGSTERLSNSPNLTEVGNCLSRI